MPSLSRAPGAPATTSRRMLPARLALLGVLAAAAPAQAEIVTIAWDAAGVFEHRQSVAPGTFAELCGKLAAGDSVRWRFESDAPLSFNIHYHVGEKVAYPARQDRVATLEGTLPVGKDQDYCWMWTNKSAAPAGLSVRLAR